MVLAFKNPERRPWTQVCRAILIATGLSCAAGSAQAWSSDRHAYPDSIKEFPATAAAGAPRVVRTELSAAEHGAPMTFEIALRMRSFPELQTRIANGELVPAGEMEARYFPLQADYDRVLQWIQDQGFTVARTDANRLAVFARGSVDATANAFQVTFARVNYRGAEYTSATTAPSLPAELSPVVLGIHGLQPHLRPHRTIRPMPMARPQTTSYTPAQILTAYGAGSVTQTGAGQTIAIIEEANPLTSDLTQFWSIVGVTDSTANIQFVSVGLGPDASSVGGYSSELEEADLDAEWASGLAPGAVIRIYGAGSLDPGSFDEAYQQIYADLAEHPQIHQLSLSFGNNEDDLDRDYFLIESQYMANLASAGVTVFAASGDGGANPDPSTGEYNPSAPLQVDYPASDPSVTGVGGTTLLLNTNNTTQSEIGWSESGGGISTIYARPSWQTGTGISPGGYRLVPDVAASANPSEGALIVWSGSQTVVGGTSWATPTWTAFCALINQARGGTPVGFLNPKLYPLQPTSALVDIVGGGNTAYPAVAGYDMSTGLGVPNVAELIQLLGKAAGSLVILDQLGSQFVTPGQTATFEVTAYPPSQDGTSFQWQRMPSGSSTWSNLSDNATYIGSKSQNLAVTVAMQGDQFQCIVSNGSSSVTSTPAGITVGQSGVTTLAGWPEAAGSADGIGRAARFDFVASLRLDSRGNIYVADGNNNTVRKVTPDGHVTTVAGTPLVSGSTNGPAASALFNSPSGVAVDPSGNLYIADHDNYTIREITAAGVVSTLAGMPGVQGGQDGTGTGAQFYDLQDIAADGRGNLYVADGEDNNVRKVVIATGAVTTFAGSPGASGSPGFSGSNDGTGDGARFNDPAGVATDSSGNVYVSDTGNNTIREITPGGVVSTIVGEVGVAGSSDAGTGTFNGPAGLGLDSHGDIFVADLGNYTVREISASRTVVTTVAGEAGVPENVDGPLSSAQFGSPTDIAVNADGVIYVGDGINNTVRQIVMVQTVPVFGVEPENQTINQGSTVVFTGDATGASSYQWTFNGSPISNSPTGGGSATDVVSGATGPQLVIANVTSASAGNYVQVAKGPTGETASSGSANLIVASSADPGYLINLSARGFVGTGSNILIGGFYIVGSTSRTVLIQALGPALASEGVSGVLQQPALTIHNAAGATIYSNTGWGSSQLLLNAAAAAYANPVLQAGSADSEVLLTLPPGGYTAEVAGADGGTGVALCAIYELP